MKNEKKQIVRFAFTFILLVFSLVSISNHTSATISIVIYHPLSSDDPYIQYEDTVFFDAFVDGLRNGGGHLDYVRYSMDGGSTWSDPIYPAPRTDSVTIDDQKEAEEYPVGVYDFIVEVKCLFHPEECETDSEEFTIGSVDVSIQSPSQDQYLDLDNVDQNVVLKVYKSDLIRMYIKKPSTSQWIQCDNVTTGYDDNNQHTVSDFDIEYGYLINEADVAYEDICYTDFEMKFLNEYEGYTDAAYLDFKVIWNSAEFNFSIVEIYTGTFGAESVGEIYWELEKMIYGQFLTSATAEGLDQETIYDCADEWDNETDYKHYYGNSADNSPAGWWRKFDNGTEIAIVNQRRSIYLWEDDPCDDDLMHIFYFWLDPDSNHPSSSEMITHGIEGKYLDQSGNDGSIYWDFEPGQEWEDHLKKIYFTSLQLNPCRFEPN